MEDYMITGCTRFFENKWLREFEVVPTIDELNNYLKYSVKIQDYVSYYDKKKGNVDNVLDIYWIVKKDLILKIDPLSKSAVTFYTIKEAKNNLKQEKESDGK